MFDQMDVEELNELLHDAIEMQDLHLFQRVRAEIDKRRSLYE